MTPNARRLIANAICARLRDNGRGQAFKWDRTRNDEYIAGAPNPRRSSGLHSGGYKPLLPTHERVLGPEFIDFEIWADDALGTPDIVGALAKTDHDALISRLHPLDQAIYRVAILRRTSVPFHADGNRMRWASKRFPNSAMRTLYALARLTDLNEVNPLDAADVFYERYEQHADLDTLERIATPALHTKT